MFLLGITRGGSTDSLVLRAQGTVIQVSQHSLGRSFTPQVRRPKVLPDSLVGLNPRQAHAVNERNSRPSMSQELELGSPFLGVFLALEQL